MSENICNQCGKNLANAPSLRRHINTQHSKEDLFVCGGCGKTYLDPAGRSRCQARHSKSFGCPVLGCDYLSSRRDSVKQHMRRKHPRCLHLYIITLYGIIKPPKRSSKNTDPSPSPDPTTDPMPGPSTLQEHLDATNPWPGFPITPHTTPYSGIPHWNWR